MMPAYYAAGEHVFDECRIRRAGMNDYLIYEITHCHNCEMWRPGTHKCNLSQQWIEYVPNTAEAKK
jgi:hypothetical protein